MIFSDFSLTMKKNFPGSFQICGIPINGYQHLSATVPKSCVAALRIAQEGEANPVMARMSPFPAYCRVWIPSEVSW